MSPDYAVVAQKAGDANFLAATNPAFEAEYGLTLESLTRKYDLQTEIRTTQIEARVAQIEVRIAQTEARAAQTEARFVSMQNSISWCLTVPLRWAAKKLRKIRDM